MHEKRLLNNLLATYNTLERPVANESDPLLVKFGLTLQQIIDVVSCPPKWIYPLLLTDSAIDDDVTHYSLKSPIH